ncbi:PIG-L family deacetylase [Isoptericola sp. S6320L]|uniref:PIG-L deacetylase family protein n=1 Tax=Isoptericola sp. S6320L TaxID=2926411 RepID=UPI001FF6B9C2|nr:PIG-L family deacetylase [Isoptericola sp. S6320L]MCK0118403.1 PIG-L family deacetylase [Isoptericola sp. S6320L]
MIELHPGSGPLHVVGLAAHPDDLEIACGGTLIRLSGRPGATASFLTMTGTQDREAEARRAASEVWPGADARFARLPDGRLPQHWGAVKDALHAFADACPAPDLVLAPRSDDAHQDHRLIGELVTTVWRDAVVLHYEIPKWDGDLGRTSAYVPLDEETVQRKLEILDACYPSQVHHDWWDHATFEGLMRMRGVECRSRFAEAFALHKAVLGL